MADKNIVKQKQAQKRRMRVRGKIHGTPEIPRLTVAKSLNNVFAQVIDDVNRVTLVAVASNSKSVKEKLKDKMTKVQISSVVGETIATLAKEKGIENVVFDRNISLYHGRIKAVADGARKAGLKF